MSSDRRRIIGFLVCFSMLLSGVFLTVRGLDSKSVSSESLAEMVDLETRADSGHWIEAVMACDSSEAIQQARVRGEMMRTLMRTNPKQAIRVALSLSEWSALPREIQVHVEQPFSAVADVEVMIACGEDDAKTFVTTELPDVGTMETSVYGRRGAVGSKIGIPVQGIRVDDVGVLREGIFQPLDAADEMAALDLYPVAIEKSGDDAVPALAGGRIFYFRSPAALAEANSRITKLENLPGPNSGAQELFHSLEAFVGEGGAIDYEALEDRALAASEAWTGTPRDMYVIMADFPDIPGAPTDPHAFSNLLNTTVSQQFWEMSHEKTHIAAVVNTNTYRLAQLSSNYTNYPTLIHSEAVALVTGEGVDLAPYETVCIIFPYVDGMGFGGFASIGMSRMLLNGTTNAYVVTHELGHSYGAGHASSWQVWGTDPVNPAANLIQYGDFLDIMGSGTLPHGHFNIWHQKNLGWIGDENRYAVTNSGTYRIYRSDHRQTTGMLRGLEIDKGNPTNQYWVGFRQEYPDYETYSRGAYLLWKRPDDIRSFLIDTSPLSPGGRFDGGIALGQTYSDSAAGVHITPVSRGGQTPDEWMDIRVNLGSFPGNSAPIALLNVPARAAVQTGTLLSVSASDPNGDELAYFWDIGDGLVKPNSPTIPVAWSSVGEKTVSCMVSDMKGGTHQVFKAITVYPNPMENWSSRVSGTTIDLFDITSGNGRLVAVGKYGKIVYSDNATNWTEVAISTWAHLNGIIYADSKYVAAGYDYDFTDSQYEGAILTSTDGISWVRPHLDGEYLNDIAFGGGVYIAVGTAGAIIRSTDGVSWNPVVSGTTSNLYGVSYGDGTFVAVGFKPGSDFSTTVLTSADGLSWSNHSSGVGLTGDQSFDEVQYCNDRFLASGFKARILQSTDLGQTFTTSMTGTELKIPAFAYGSGVYFAAGTTWITGQDINLISSDGVNWSALATGSQENRNAAIFYNDTFITVGDNGSIHQTGPVSAPPGSGYGVWQLENESVLGLNRDPLDDADFDGVENLVEYALGTSATDDGETPAYSSSATGTYFQLSVDRDGIRSDINYQAERSENLLSNDWNSAETVVVNNSASNLTVRSAVPMAGQTNEFLRLNIEQQ